MQKNWLAWLGRKQVWSLALVGAVLALPHQGAQADWHYGKVVDVYFTYDGTTPTILIEGVSRNNCTCYPAWPNRMCLDRTRASFKEEIATILLAKATERRIAINVDEASCKLIALGLE